MTPYDNMEEWKKAVAASSYILPTDVLRFGEPNTRYDGQSFVCARVVPNGGQEEWRSILLGCYETKSNKGWYYP